MERCRILIVEDELIVRKALRYIIEQEAQTFEIIGEVTNGEEALEFLEHDIPHIMICDIMMPRMNGLELLCASNLKYPEVCSIVLSGYHDFEYVKQAFQYGVLDYILKPELECDGLLKSLYHTVKKLGLAKTVPPLSKSLEPADTGGELYSVHYLIAVQPGKVLQKDYKKKDLMISYIEDALQQSFGRSYLHSFSLKKQQVLIYTIGCHYPEMFHERLTVFFDKASLWFRNIEIIISTRVDAPSDLEKTALRIAGMFPFRFFDEGKEYLNLADGLSPSGELDKKEFYGLVRQLKLKQAGELLVRYLETLRGCFAVSELSLKKYMENLVYNTVFELGEVKCCPQNLENRKMSYLSDIGQADNLDLFIQSICRIFDDMQQITEEMCESDRLYHEIINYIYNHYHEPITLKTLADAFNMNYTYLSAYLSARMGQGMNEFLNSVRVEKARELLAATDLPLSEIAVKTGYTDQSYFSRVFKKQTGFSPHTYRSQSRRN